MTELATTPESVVVVRQLETPWMTVDEAAPYIRRSKEYVRRGIREYIRSKGRSGLKALRPKPNAAYTVHHDDLIRWLAGEPPAKGMRKFAST